MRLAWTGPNMVAALEESKPGCCPYCDRPSRAFQSARTLRKGQRIENRHVLCGRDECLRLYQRDYGRDRRPNASRAVVETFLDGQLLECGHFARFTYDRAEQSRCRRRQCRECADFVREKKVVAEKRAG